VAVEVFAFLGHHLQLMGGGKVADDFQFEHEKTSRESN
jgi:hypothetical protein